MSHKTFLSRSILICSLLLACKTEKVPYPSEQFVAPPADSVWPDDPALILPVTASYIKDLISILDRLDTISQKLASARAEDCLGPNPAIIPVANAAAAKLDTLFIIRASFQSAPKNLTQKGQEGWFQAGLAINSLFTDGRRLLDAAKDRPISEALIRSGGLSLNAKSLRAKESLTSVLPEILPPGNPQATAQEKPSIFLGA